MFMTKKKKEKIIKRLGWIMVAINHSEGLPVDVYEKIVNFIMDIGFLIGGLPMATAIKEYYESICSKIEEEREKINDK